MVRFSYTENLLKRVKIPTQRQGCLKEYSELSKI